MRTCHRQACAGSWASLSLLLFHALGREHDQAGLARSCSGKSTGACWHAGQAGAAITETGSGCGGNQVWTRAAINRPPMLACIWPVRFSNSGSPPEQVDTVAGPTASAAAQLSFRRQQEPASVTSSCRGTSARGKTRASRVPRRIRPLQDPCCSRDRVSEAGPTAAVALAACNRENGGHKAAQPTAPTQAQGRIFCPNAGCCRWIGSRKNSSRHSAGPLHAPGGTAHHGLGFNGHQGPRGPPSQAFSTATSFSATREARTIERAAG